MTDENRQLIAELVSMPHFAALKEELNKRISKVRDITEVDMSDPNFAAIAMGKKLAAETISEMLVDLGLFGQKQEDKRNTYE